MMQGSPLGGQIELQGTLKQWVEELEPCMGGKCQQTPSHLHAQPE